MACRKNPGQINIKTDQLVEMRNIDSAVIEKSNGPSAKLSDLKTSNQSNKKKINLPLSSNEPINNDPIASLQKESIKSLQTTLMQNPQIIGELYNLKSNKDILSILGTERIVY